MVTPTSAEVRYPVVFRTQTSGPVTGALVIGEQALKLTGSGDAGPVELAVGCEEIERTRIGRSPAERINGYATVVLDLSGGPTVLIAPYGSHLLHEISDLLAALNAGRGRAEGRVDLIVPIRSGCEQRVRELIAAGPPFDPALFSRHQVYLGDGDVVFTFIGPDVQATLQETMSVPGLWRAGVAWRNCIAGRPRLAPVGYAPEHGRELIFTWPRADGRAAALSETS